MRPLSQTVKVPPSGRSAGMETVRFCGAVATWRIVKGNERVYVCDACRPKLEQSMPDGIHIERIDGDQ